MSLLKEQRNTGSKIGTQSPTSGQLHREVDFVLECIGAEHAYVCGDFNDWKPTCLRMIGNPDDGLWEKRLILAPGRYEYKFVVDGKWLHDPNGDEKIKSIYGTLNSVVEVQP